MYFSIQHLSVHLDHKFEFLVLVTYSSILPSFKIKITTRIDQKSGSPKRLCELDFKSLCMTVPKIMWAINRNQLYFSASTPSSLLWSFTWRYFCLKYNTIQCQFARAIISCSAKMANIFFFARQNCRNRLFYRLYFFLSLVQETDDFWLK